MSQSDGAKKRKNEEGGTLDSIADAAVHLHGLLQTKENELKEREADFNRRVKLFETENPSVGKDNDVIQLNVGGNTNIAVLRRTLTQFEDSMLAARFSGRWDDSLEKDRDGNFFVDQDPENFLDLIGFLRLRNNRPKIEVRVPNPTYEFCSMLEYYNLMSSIYPQKWLGNNANFSCEEQSHGTCVLSTVKDDNDANSATVLYDLGKCGPGGVTEFFVEFEAGTTGSVGWIEHDRDPTTISADSQLLRSGSRTNSIYLSVTERKIYGPSDLLEENLRIDHVETSTKVICKYDGNAKAGTYSIQVVDVKPGGYSAPLSSSKKNLDTRPSY